MSDPPRPRLPTAMTVTISRRTIFLVLLIVAAVWVVMHLVNVLIVLFSAILLATAIDAPVDWLQRRGIPRSVGVLAMYAVLVVVLAGVVALLVPLVSSEIATVQDDLPGWTTRLEDFVNRVRPAGSERAHLTFDDLSKRLSSHLGTVASTLTNVSLAAGHVLVLVFITLVAAYYLAASPGGGSYIIDRFVPRAYQPRATAIAAAVRDRIGGWVRGQALVAGTFGIGMGIGLWLIGVPFAVSLGVIAGVLELVPYVGGAVTLLLALPLALTVGWPHAIGVLVLYTVLVNIEAHVLSPWYVGRAVHLPPVVVLIALLAGAELAGLIGILLAIPATVVVWAVMDEVWPEPGETPPPAPSPAKGGGDGG
ncbi:MAG TPA: AI-2E family transporter [Thermomicrobiales bacterium]|nr:AI-2E family transporter [Thermomicrobiales bacterium]